MRRILREGLVVALIGAAVAFAANALSPRGLKLNRDYFNEKLLSRIATTNQTVKVVGTNAATPAEILAAKFKQADLELISSNQVVELFRDPRREQDLILFIDARREEEYRQGHVPGALLFDNYYRDKYIPPAIPLCQVAQQIVVYCHGGDCEDSMHTALTLRQFLPGRPKESLVIYGGGFAEWCTNGLPVEAGERNSGQLLKSAP